MTFEQAFKNYLLTNLKEYITTKDIVVANDINHRPLEKDANSILAIVGTGFGDKLTTSNGNYTTTSFTINFLFDANDLQSVLSGLQNFIDTENAVFKEVLLDNDTYVYKPIFTSPYPIGGLNEVISTNDKGQKLSLKIVNVVLNVNVAYSSDIDFKPNVYKLTIGATEYTINGIDSYSNVSAPNYEQIQYLNEKFGRHLKLTNITTFSFTLIASKEDALHTLLLNDFTSTNPISSSVLKLKKDSETAIDISTINITETWANGAKVITLLLGR